MQDDDGTDERNGTLSFTRLEGWLVKKRVLGFLLSAASVYLTMSYLSNLFLTIIGSFTFNVL